MKVKRRLLFIVACCTYLALYAQNADSPADTIMLVPMPVEELAPAAVEVADYELAASSGRLIFRSGALNGVDTIQLNGEPTELVFNNGQARLPLELDAAGRLLMIENGNQQRLYHVAQYKNGDYRLRHIPLWLSILPPLVAIGLALIFREVVISLFAGVWVGSFIAGGLRIDSLYYFIVSIFEVVSKYVLQALNDGGHLSVIIFSMLIGGMVAIISRNGGMAGVVTNLARYARSDRSSQFITWLLGVAIFFDDYANTLIVGNTMRSVTDRFRVSREKLAYIVDSTAAPVAAVAFITTWIGAELGYIDDGISLLSGFDAALTPYAIFIQSLKYSFYPIFTLVFILFLIRTGRDFGPMHKAEIRARTTGEVSGPRTESGEGESTEDLNPVAGAPLRAYNAVIPVLVVIFMTIFGLLDTGLTSVYNQLVEAGQTPATSGWGATWGAMDVLLAGESAGFFRRLGLVIGSSDSYVALLWASTSGVIVAILLTLAARIMSLERAIGTMTTGFKTMLPALIILTLAWSLAATTEELHTAGFLTHSLRESLNPYFLPPIIFVLAAAISFSTGSSWSTMAILYPIAIPITWAVSNAQGIDPEHSLELLFNVIATVLAASVLGDHCSPISDTTILSSLASDCSHIDHVRTQLPYALTVGVVSLVMGTLATWLGGGWLVCLLLMVVGLLALYLLVRFMGKSVTSTVSTDV